MLNPFDFPVLLFFITVLVFGVAARIGYKCREKSPIHGERLEQDFSFILGGTLTLLGLIIGFTFSMAVSRYDQRKNYEEQEANAIGTEYVRADLMPPGDAPKVRQLLRGYLQQRIRYYQSRNPAELQKINEETPRLQADLWSAAAAFGSARPSPISSLVVSGMNDVLNTQGYSQAMWWNRIPVAAWLLLIALSVFCNLLIGYGAHGKNAILLLTLPIALALSLFLIADIDSPRGGVIKVAPQNLQSLADSLK